MALGQAILCLFYLGGFCLGFSSLGTFILRRLRVTLRPASAYVLVSIAVGLVFTEIYLFLIQFTQHLRLASGILVALLCCLLVLEWKSVWRPVRFTLAQIVPAEPLDRFLLLLIGIAVSVEFLVAMAPLTGSDAMHYHFTVQKAILEHGFHPMFSNIHSFLCGQHHLLILLGLALGSERLAMGFIFLGGVLTAASMAFLISRWASNRIVALFSLLFLLTPVVFWQISTSGSPDIFMAVLTCAVVIVLCQEENRLRWQNIVLAGLLAGGIAGAKYTGCIIAAAFALAIWLEFRSTAAMLLFAGGSLISGVWPYLRNMLWTRNPLFPFLSAKLSPELVTAYAMANLANDTGASPGHALSQLFPFVFLAAVQERSPGFWDFFGPVVLALSPLILLAYRNTRTWRVPVLVWFTSGLGIFFASGLPRFLLPLFPIGLACVAAGLEVISERKWRVARAVTAGLVFVMCSAGAAGLVMYSEIPLLVTMGITSPTSYLRQKAPDYVIAEAINQSVVGEQPRRRTLVFLRHMYYLDILYLNGDPGTSFEIDPSQLQTSEEWKDFFKRKEIGYVVRSPDYPPAIRKPFFEMEQSGELMPLTQMEVDSIQGNRIDQKRSSTQVVIFRVRQ
jgi:Protein of unknown function (DUF1420)